nr:MAG TPA: hypothetical protein [Bacteriophage sp.]
MNINIINDIVAILRVIYNIITNIYPISNKV